MTKLMIARFNSGRADETFAPRFGSEKLDTVTAGDLGVDGGAGLFDVLAELPTPTRVACDVDVPLVDAARLFARQKGASSEEAVELERRLVVG
jgi:hypothetical protein